MSLNKAIEHGKEFRKPYTDSKAIDYQCRNHGACDWCKSNRLFSNFKRGLDSLCQLKEYLGLHIYGKNIKFKRIRRA